MWEKKNHRNQSRKSVKLATFVLALCSYFDHVASMPATFDDDNSWPTFPHRNIGALAREGYLRSALNGYKRSISTLAKNGQLPTFRAPFDGSDHKDDDDESEGSSESKRNLASIARLRSYSAIKRNIQALARDGYRFGRTNNQGADKRNVASLARGGFIHKRDEGNEDEYILPFYQNSVPPLSEIDGPYDFSELYDYQQSLHPDMLPPLLQPLKSSALDDNQSGQMFVQIGDKLGDNLKRGASGLPVHGLIRTTYVDPNNRNKRYIMMMPDQINQNDLTENEDMEVDEKRSVEDDSDVRDNFVKRHIGSLARLGLLPSFRFSGGRYSRSGRARLMLPSQEMYRKHSYDENFGVREYFPSSEVDPAADPNDADVPSPALPAHSHPTGRLLHRPLNNDLPDYPPHPAPAPPLPPPTHFIDSINNNRWQTTKEVPRFYYFRSLKVPHHVSGKRYLLLPAVDNILLRKNYPNSSLPSRRKNQ